MVREFQRVVGDEAREQCRVLLDGGDPDYVVACVGGGSNAAGTFAGFVDTDAQLVGVEAAGGAAIGRGVPGVLHGMKSYLLQDEWGQILEAQSISAGSGLPGHRARARPPVRAAAGPATARPATREVLDALQLLARTEGIIPALEPAHALAWVIRACASGELPAGSTVLVTLSGRGDKDAEQVMGLLDGDRRRASARSRPTPAGRPGPRAASCWSPTSPAGSDPTGWTSCGPWSAAGADAVEVGIPFSDPVMDGPTIQEASVRALLPGPPRRDPRRAARRRRRRSRWWP